MQYDYVSVSMDGQSVTAQVTQLRAVGCQHVFRELASGAKSVRRALRRALDQFATAADRKAGFWSLGDTRADTTSRHGRLMLTVLGGLAEFALDLIRATTSEGPARAVARGVTMRPKPKLTPHQMKEAIQRRECRDEMLREIARSYDVSHCMDSRV
jgi:DNA invertase Pin-like site-specific DNA recombinase